MEGRAIQIGPINLQNFEIPPSIRFGGRHRLALHRLSSGKRVVERLGPDDGEVSFRGTFSGPDAEARVRAFDNLRLSGDVVWLTWQSFRRRVVVKSFIADYHSPAWILYRASCVVVHQDGVLASGTSTIASLIFADLANAMSAGSALPIQLNTLQTALSTPNAFTNGTADNTSAANAVQVGLSGIDTQIAQQSAEIAAPQATTADPRGYSSAVAATVDAAGSLAAAVNTKSYVARIGVNLNGVGI